MLTGRLAWWSGRMADDSRRRANDRSSLRRVSIRVAKGTGLLLILALGTWAGLSLLGPPPLTLAARAYEQGAWREAASGAREILRSEPGRREAMKLLARAEARLGRDQFARSIYQRLDPTGLEAEDYFLVSRGLIAEGLLAQGRDGLVRALRLDPGHPESLLELVRLDRRSDRLSEAGERAARLAERPRWEARGLVLLGLVRLGQQDPAAAARSFRSALTRDPALVGVEEGSPDEVRKWLVESLLRTGEPAEARTHLDVLLTARPGDAEASWLLSRAALQQHDPAAAAAAAVAGGDFRAAHPEAFEHAPYVGFARCAECHPAIFQAQRASRHAQTFHAKGDLELLPLPDGPKADPAGPEVVHTLSREGRDIAFRTSTAHGEMRALVEFVMGSGDRARTLVGRDSNQNWRELRLSYYGSIGDWDRTPSHRVRPDAPHEFLGQVQTEDAIRRCLNCHTTHSRVGPNSFDVSSERGFSCERCHGPAGNHLDAVALKFPDPAIARPRLATAARVNALCGQCHGAGGRGITADDPDLARFQASALPLSRCATEDRGSTMSCLTCHSPHRNAETSPAYYEAKCLKCHAKEPETGSMPAGHTSQQGQLAHDKARRVPCPVEPARGCVSCHMRRVQTSVPHTTFTDHFIRVHPVKPEQARREHAGPPH